MGGRTEPASKGDHPTIIARLRWLSDQAQRLADVISLEPGPSFSFYQDRWGADSLVQIMGMAERGMHLTLMCFAWQSSPFCSLPDDEVMLRAWCGHPEPSAWEHHRAVLFSGKDGDPRRAWVFEGGRWWQIGLGRSLLEQVARRLRRQTAGFMRVANSKRKERESEADFRERTSNAREVAEQCRAILDALQRLPVPVPSPLPVPVPESVETSLPGGRAPADSGTAGSNGAHGQSPEVEAAWSALIEARKTACRVVGIKPSAIRLTAKRADHLAALLGDYGLDYLRQAWGAVQRSDYHLGRGRHRDPHLSFEALTSTGGKVNQPEILHQLAEAPERRDQPSTRPFAPEQDPEGSPDDGSAIE